MVWHVLVVRLVLVIEVHVKDVLVVFAFLVRDSKAKTNLIKHILHVLRMLYIFKHLFLRFEVLNLE